MIVPLSIVALTTFAGIFFWGGMDFYILGLPASFHDVIYLLILSLAINPKDRRQSYHVVVCWFVAGLFIVQSLLQIFDLRPPGDAGLYDLYTDNIANALYIAGFLLLLSRLTALKIIRFTGRSVYFYIISMLFLAFNALLTVDSVRDVVKNYALAYDIIYYVCLYMISLSTCRPINDFIRNSFDRVRGRLHFSRHYIQ